MLRGIWGDPERYHETYWCRFEGRYFAGDGAKRRRRRLPLAAGPGRRRHERVGPPHLDHRGRVGARRPPGGRRGRGGRAPPTPPPARRSSRSSSSGRRRADRDARSRSCASTWPRRSARSPGRRRSSSPRPAQDPFAARSCAGCCATSPRAATWRHHHARRPGVVEEIRKRRASSPTDRGRPGVVAPRLRSGERTAASCRTRR